ncbi:hypothetical protein BU15DRAFT_71706 [Melanogaster broomeanus]|nr:hypothetical protein BU15DRAFT_71706 [Melanogaster broomeanus]
MVVTRRTPVIPPAPVSRTHSSEGTHRPGQDTPETSKTQPEHRNGIVSVHATSRYPVSAAPFGMRSIFPVASSAPPWFSILAAVQVLISSQDNHSGKKPKKYRKHGKIKYQKSNFQAFLEFLTKLLLLAFTIYAFSVCPQDTQSQSPICRGLTEYKRIVLDPYVIPPLQATLAHPSIAPHIERAKPYVDRAVELTTPILLRTQEEWNLRVVPQWERRIVPEWNKRVVPHWNIYVVPRIELLRATVEPYRFRAIHECEQRIAPHARVAMYNLHRWQRQAQPYISVGVSKIQDGYHATRPYVVPWAKQFGHALQQFALFLQEQRQKFVDPHVAKIWEKVKELSRGKQVVHDAIPERESWSPDPVITILETLGSETTFSSTPSPAIRASYSTVDVPVEPSVTPVAEPTTRREPLSTPTDVEILRSAESIVAESLHQPASFTAETSASISAPSPTIDEPVFHSHRGRTPGKYSLGKHGHNGAQSFTPTDDEIDIDAFYAELGLNEPLENSSGSSEYSPVPPSPPAETEEERAERLRLKAEETAHKRAGIEARHAKWEAELQAQIERSTAQLQSRLYSLREAAAADLASSDEVRNSIEELATEAEKYIKGAEIYLKNLKGENRKSDEKLALWDRVVDKVGNKFTERLLATEGIVNAWYRAVIDMELQEVTAATADVRDVAEKGQVDLGLDYAWLDDVTYNDWQRYHALIGTSEQYAEEAASIQNGTHPSAPAPNPLIPIFDDLQSEVRDVVIGFETRLRRIKRDGERAFNSNNGNDAAQKEEEKGSAVEPEPEVSILPVPHEGVRGGAQEFIPHVVIGRSQEEVLEALGKVEPLGDAKTTSEGSSC